MGEYRCPEDCGLAFNTETELLSHLDWDHNWSRSRIERWRDSR